MSDKNLQIRLDEALREGMYDAEMGLCITGPVRAEDDWWEHILKDNPERKWAKDFKANPFRINSIEIDLATLSQDEFEQAFGAEPIWCLNAMIERAENSLGMSYIYDGCKAVVKGQIIRCLTLNHTLDGEALIKVATTTAKYTSTIYDHTPQEKFQPMIRAISEAVRAVEEN